MSELRSPPPTKAGLITFGPKRVECTVRSITGTGATLKVSSAKTIPDQFALVVAEEYKVYACTVVSRNDASLHVAFA